MEIENDAAPNSAIAELTAALNAAVGAGTYAYIDTGVVGTDEIRVALHLQAGVGDARSAPSPCSRRRTTRCSSTRSTVRRWRRRSAENANGQRFTVVVNHLKSKGSDCNAVGDPDTGDGQGNCNVTRTNAATALANWLETDPTGSGDPDFLIIGDLNSYAKEDPIKALEADGYTNLTASFHGPEAYSYVFDGQSGYLDHALANAALAPQVTGVTEWHINADEPIALDYNTNFKSAEPRQHAVRAGRLPVVGPRPGDRRPVPGADAAVSVSPNVCGRRTTSTAPWWRRRRRRTTSSTSSSSRRPRTNPTTARTTATRRTTSSSSTTSP